MKYPIGWARVKRAEPGPMPGTTPYGAEMLRRGAWYPVVRDDASREVVLEVSRNEVAVPRDSLQIRRHQTERFSVVARSPGDPNPVRGTPADLGQTYAVCPSSRSRVRLTEHTDVLECPQCGHGHQVAWDQLC